MRASWVLATYTLRESARRRVFIVVPIATAGFLGLYALGAHYAFRFSKGTVHQGPGVLVDARSLAGATLVGLSMFVTLFLGSVLAVFLTFGTVRGDAEQGLLQPVVVRPLRRPIVLLGRFIGTAIVCVAYVLFLYLASVLITGATGGWWPNPLVSPGLDLAAGVLIVTALSLVGSVFLTTVTNGIAVLMIYGAALLAGLLGQIGVALSSPRLITVGKVGSWALPFEALYQNGLNDLTANMTGLTRVIVQLGPLGGAQAGGAALLLWSLLYLVLVAVVATAAFARRDL
jgi:ABC-type transport system involved in multi-copper enzyme maturation permease subunit